MTLLLLFNAPASSGATGTAFQSFVEAGMFLGIWQLDDYLTFTVCIHDNTGAAADADAVPSYAIYENETATAIVTGNMAKLGSVDGFYSERVQLTAASDFEIGKCYVIRIAATVGAIPAAATHVFQMGAQINSVSSTISANVVQMNGDTDPVDNLVLALGNSDGITAHPQGIADALKLAPASGDPATGSVYDSLVGPISAQLADGVVHGGWNSYLLLKSLDIRNTDAGGLGIYVLASDAILGGRAIQIDGTGLSKAIEINGVFDADLSGTIAGLTADAQQDVADAANNLAPALTGATGSIRAKLDAIKLVTDAIDSSAVTVTSTNNAGVLTFTQGVTFTATVSGLTISATWAKLYFTLKESDYDTDDMALIQIVENNPAAGTDGLLYLNSAAIASPITVADGTLTVSQAAGTVAIAITDNAMAALSKASGLVWDIKTKDAAGATVQNATGTASIGRAITQTI